MVGLQAHRAGWIVVAATLTALTAGCGGSGVLVSAGQTRSLRSTPSTPPQPLTIVPAPAATPALPAARVEAKLTATVRTLQKATLGMGKATAEVEVSNSAPITLQGTVKVTFVATGREPKIQSRTVTLPPQGRETLSFVEASWFVKEATVQVETSNGGLDPHTPGTY